MRKIILVLDAEKWSRDTVDIGCYLAKMSRSEVNAVFLKRPAAEGAMQTAHGHTERVVNNTLPFEPAFVTRLKDACIGRETGCAVHPQQLNTVAEILDMSLFSDLMVIDPAISLHEDMEVLPSSLTKHIMHHAHCPVVMAQGAFRDMEEIIFTYDGSVAATHAIRQFSYLFPGLAGSHITVLEISRPGAKHREAKTKLMEWMNVHYHHVAYVALAGHASGTLSRYLLAHPKALVVMGAYGRSAMSRLLRPSTANPVAGTVNNPIFIAHH